MWDNMKVCDNSNTLPVILHIRTIKSKKKNLEIPDMSYT